MIKRQLYHLLHQLKEVPQIIQISGMRQTGKTSLMRFFHSELKCGSLYSLQEIDTLRKIESDIAGWLSEVESYKPPAFDFC